MLLNAEGMQALCRLWERVGRKMGQPYKEKGTILLNF